MKEPQHQAFLDEVTSQLLQMKIEEDKVFRCSKGQTTQDQILDWLFCHAPKDKVMMQDSLNMLSLMKQVD